MSKTDTENTNHAPATKPDARCLAIAREGIYTSPQLARYLSALMSDVIEGTVAPIVANAGVNAAGKLLKTVEMQQKYGTPNGRGSRMIQLCGDEVQAPAIVDNTKAGEITALKARLAELEASGEQ